MALELPPGKISVWRYPAREGPDLHFTADNRSAAFVGELLQRFDSEFEQRTIALTEPTIEILKVPNFGGRTVSASALKLQFLPGEKFAELWKLVVQGETVEIKFGMSKRDELIEAMQALPGGDGDYSISSDEPEGVEPALWIWWFFTTRRPRAADTKSQACERRFR